MAFLQLDPAIVNIMSTFLQFPLLWVSKDWARGVEDFKAEITRKFLYAEFKVEWLGVGSKMQMRVTRALTQLSLHGEVPNIIRWWQGTSEALGMFCGRYRFPGASFDAVVRQCYVHSEMSQYDLGLFKDFLRRETSVKLDEIITREIWHDKNYIEARDMGCPYLRKSVLEVLWTLICAIQGTQFCIEHCGCEAYDDLERDARSQLRYFDGR